MVSGVAEKTQGGSEFIITSQRAASINLQPFGHYSNLWVLSETSLQSFYSGRMVDFHFFFVLVRISLVLWYFRSVYLVELLGNFGLLLPDYTVWFR